MSLNDPQWGKRGRTGPPDLDEIWRTVVRRFNELFGRKDPIDVGDDSTPPKRQLPLGSAGLLVALVLVVWLVSGSYIVDDGRRGVVTRFGKYTETTLPGRTEVHRYTVLHDLVLLENLVENSERTASVHHVIFRDDLEPSNDGLVL